MRNEAQLTYFPEAYIKCQILLARCGLAIADLYNKESLSPNYSNREIYDHNKYVSFEM